MQFFGKVRAEKWLNCYMDFLLWGRTIKEKGTEFWFLALGDEGEEKGRERREGIRKKEKQGG